MALIMVCDVGRKRKGRESSIRGGGGGEGGEGGRRKEDSSSNSRGRVEKLEG